MTAFGLGSGYSELAQRLDAYTNGVNYPQDNYNALSSYFGDFFDIMKGVVDKKVMTLPISKLQADPNTLGGIAAIGSETQLLTTQNETVQGGVRAAQKFESGLWTKI